jgi:hypothetical protein
MHYLYRRRYEHEQVRNQNQNSKPIGTAVAPCSQIHLRIIDDRGDPSTTAGITKNRVNVSNRETSQALPLGFSESSDDRDNFKIEIVDPFVVGNIISSSQVEVEMFLPGKPHKPFSPRRKLNVELQRVGISGHLFRSRYLRLVVDEIDQGANRSQTILADWDPSNPKIEILGQVMRVKYKSSFCTMMTQATVGGPNRSFIPIAVHVLRYDNGRPVVALDAARRRILKWVRRVYAQINMAPKLVLVREVDPVRNLVSISNGTGARAWKARGKIPDMLPRNLEEVEEAVKGILGASQISFQIRSVAAGRKDIVQDIGPVYLIPFSTPIMTAQRLAKLIKPPFTARTVENPRMRGSLVDSGSADIIITDTSGGRIVVDECISTDPAQTISAGVVNPGILISSFGYADMLVGSIEQRTALHAYNTGHDRIDLIVAEKFSGNLLGQAMISGTFEKPAYRALPEVKMSAFLASETMDGTDDEPFACPHEIGHVLLDATHVVGDNTQLMKSGYLGGNFVGGPKRFSESAIASDLPAHFVQETRIRSIGADLLVPFE